MGFIRCWFRIWLNHSWEKAAMLCTASVEEVIDEHYQNQIDQLGPERKNLKKLKLL